MLGPLGAGGPRRLFGRVDGGTRPELEHRLGDQRGEDRVDGWTRTQPETGHRPGRRSGRLPHFRATGHADGLAQRGTLPCLRCGSSPRFDASIARLRESTLRVSAGEMTSSTYPRSAAMYGVA